MLGKFAPIVGLLIALPLALAAQTNPQEKPAPEPVSAQKQALIAELLTATHNQKNVEDLLNAALEESTKEVPQIIWEGLSGSPLMANLTNEEREKLRGEIFNSMTRISQRYRDLLKERLDYRKFDEISAAIFAKYFDENQLVDLIAFYKSATGQHSLEIMPKLFAESMVRSQELMLPILKELMREVSTEETEKFQKEVAAIAESHHSVQKSRGNTRRRPN